MYLMLPKIALMRPFTRNKRPAGLHSFKRRHYISYNAIYELQLPITSCYNGYIFHSQQHYQSYRVLPVWIWRRSRGDPRYLAWPRRRGQTYRHAQIQPPARGIYILPGFWYPSSHYFGGFSFIPSLSNFFFLFPCFDFLCFLPYLPLFSWIIPAQPIMSLIW